MAAAALVDLHVVERLIGEQFDTVNASEVIKLLPGQPFPTGPARSFAQYLGCDFDTLDRSTANDENQTLNVTAEFLIACPVTDTRADAYQVMTAAGAVMAAIAEFSKSDANHIVTLKEATARRAVVEQLNSFRVVVVTARGTAQRTSGTSRE